MRIGSVLRNGQASLGLVSGEKVLILNEVARQEPVQYGPLMQAEDVTALWAMETRHLVFEIHQRCVSGDLSPLWEPAFIALGDCAWLPPIKAPEKIICVGLNYRDHAEETKAPLPKEPVLFSKFNNTLVGASGPVILPSNSNRVDYEAELAFVIGKRARHVPLEDASACVGGYFILHDVSARDWQFKSTQWLCGKTFDTFAPCGPYLVTPDEIPDPHDLGIRLILNGQVMQDSNTRNLLFKIPDLIHYISSIVTLQPGDIVSTGTPAGVGFARKPPVLLQDGDLVEISIEHIGTIRHRCIAEK